MPAPRARIGPKSSPSATGSVLYQHRSEDSTREKRLYVGNLSFGTTRQTIYMTFSRFGEIRAVDMPIDRVTGQLRGFVFVTMGSVQAANEAISSLNGAMLDGRKLCVNEAQMPARSGHSSRRKKPAKKKVEKIAKTPVEWRRR